jgi:hypothetical protein
MYGNVNGMDQFQGLHARRRQVNNTHSNQASGNRPYIAPFLLVTPGAYTKLNFDVIQIQLSRISSIYFVRIPKARLNP